jgi:uncharacterized protein involved in exopolysaccharide biosynthesis
MTATDGPGLTERERLADPVYRWDPRDARRSGVTEVSLRDLMRGVMGRKRLLGAVAIVTFTAIAIYTFAVTPRFKSEARLRIQTEMETQGPAALSALADSKASSMPGASLLGLGRDELETEVAVLSSDRVADATIDSLALNVRVTKPASNRAGVLSAHVVQPDVDADGKLTLTRLGNGHYSVEKKKLDDVRLPAEMIPGVPVQVGGTVVTLSPKLLGAGPSKIAVTFLPRYKVHKLLDKRLTIEQQEGGSRLVEVSFEDPDRRLAAQVVSTLVGEYVTYTTHTLHGDDTLTVTRLRAQVDSTLHKLTAAERSLRDYEVRSRLIAPDDQATADIKRLSEISTKVDAISTERNALARMLDIITRRANGGADPAAYRQLATFPSLITNQAIQGLLQSLLQLENQRAQLGVQRTEANAEYQALTDRIHEIERQLYSIGPQYLESLDQQLAMTARTASAVTDTLQALPGAAMEYARRLRDRTVSESIYVALQKELKVAELRGVLRQDKVRVVDAPRVANPHDRAFPHKAVMLSLGALLSIALALAVTLFAELWREPDADVVVRSP